MAGQCRTFAGLNAPVPHVTLVDLNAPEPMIAHDSDVPRTALAGLNAPVPRIVQQSRPENLDADWGAKVRRMSSDGMRLLAKRHYWQIEGIALTLFVMYAVTERVCDDAKSAPTVALRGLYGTSLIVMAASWALHMNRRVVRMLIGRARVLYFVGASIVRDVLGFAMLVPGGRSELISDALRRVGSIAVFVIMPLSDSACAHARMWARTHARTHAIHARTHACTHARIIQ